MNLTLRQDGPADSPGKVQDMFVNHPVLTEPLYNQRNEEYGPTKLAFRTPIQMYNGGGGVAEAGGVGRNDPEAREREMEEEGTRTQSGKN